MNPISGRYPHPPADRGAQKRDFLAKAGLADARIEPLGGDASTRAYARLHPADGSAPLILMDAPPASETAPAGADATVADRLRLGYNALARLAACRVDAFAGAATWLSARGLSAPVLHAIDVPVGLALLEDLGPGLFARRVETGEDPTPLYAAAVDVLARIQSEPAPAELPYDVAGERGAWPLLVYDALALKTGADLFLQWWPILAGGQPYGFDAVQEWDAAWAPIRARGEAGADVFAHRDYHAENLIWLPERDGLARVGLLDFQDAVRAHPAWDLIHLLQDARRNVAPELEAAMLDRYLAGRPERDPEAFRTDYAGLATLNNLRIIGLFSRLVKRDHKPRYLDFMPRMWGLVRRNLAHPGLAEVRAWFDRHVGDTA